ncbi:BppU family phage baseplate upper protein [Enterococcus casseliflavus]|uniref:BppU family phage baseplate upper protein n=1 Tax=Enterococcus casseliflavus TaxID=37734 RepID=UPI001CA947E5|nr:BppU family phage baseplate upper protein [Enterococcus casseliflavus]MBZ0323611.1 phage baseplate upper protein [Enterococcus casseliflavus]
MTNQIFKKNESIVRIQAEQSDPIRTNVVFFSHDKSTAKMLFRLEKDGAPQPLSSGTEVLIHLTLMGEEAKTHIYYANIDDPAAGLVSIILKDDTLQRQGRVEGSIYIKPPNDQHLDTSGRFLFNIERSPIDNISEDASQFYYEGFTIIYDKIAEVRKIVSTMTTEAQASVNQKIRDLETQIDRFLQDAQNKFTSLDSDIAAVRQTVTQLENRLTTVRNEIEALFNTLKIDVRNLLLDTAEPLVIVGNNTLNQTGYRYTFTFGRLRDIPAKVGDPIAIAFDWEVTGTTVGGRFFPQFSDQPYNVAGRENIAISDSNRSGTSSFVTSVQSSWLETNATSAGIGIRADELRGTLTITNFRFLSASRDSGWLPAVSEMVLQKDMEEISARNLAPNSSFYNDTQGWSIPTSLSVTSTGSYTRVVKSAAQTARATIFRSISDGRFKPNTKYTVGLMLYVESASSDATATGSTVFLRSFNNGGMLDSPLGRIDFSKVGEWQLVSGTGVTNTAPWDGNPQLTIAFQASIICTVRIKEFVIVEGSRYLGWFPDSAEIALQRHLEETQEKVQTLEENTIRLTNQFPDHDFSKQVPRPVADGDNVHIRYDNGDLVVENNHTTLRQRIYWGSPPLGLAVGKNYNVSMYLNVGTVSTNKEFEVGTSGGENMIFSVEHSSPTWRHGTIGLTGWTGFSIWMPPGTALRLRELYIYEANTDITTARIERLEKDNSLPAIVPTFATGFNNYAASGDNFCQAVRDGDMVTIRGAIAPTSVVSSGNTLNNFLMGTLPVGYGPKHIERQLAQGSGRGLYHLEITTDRRILCSRYRGHNTGYTQDDIPVGSWLVTSITYVGEDI